MNTPVKCFECGKEITDKQLLLHFKTYQCVACVECEEENRRAWEYEHEKWNEDNQIPVKGLLHTADWRF